MEFIDRNTQPMMGSLTSHVKLTVTVGIRVGAHNLRDDSRSALQQINLKFTIFQKKNPPQKYLELNNFELLDNE